MRLRQTLLAAVLLCVGVAFAASPSNDVNALADAIGLPAPGPVYVGDDEDIDDASRIHRDLTNSARQSDNPRRAQWAAAWLCAERGDFACALRQWHVAAQSATQPPRWLPEAYALALWGLDRHEQAVAWYDTAVLATPQLGIGGSLPRFYADASLLKVAEALFESWGQRLAPLRKAVASAVDIDSDGRVTRVQVIDDQLDPVLTRRIQQVIADWQFPRKADQPSPSLLSTHVYTEVRGRPDGEQRMVFDVQFVGFGVRPEYMHPPRYPIKARQRRQEGACVVKVDLDTSGNVVHARIDKASGIPALDQAALAAARRWRFTMDRIDGQPVASEARLPFVFTLNADFDAPSRDSNNLKAATKDRSGTAF